MRKRFSFTGTDLRKNDPMPATPDKWLDRTPCHGPYLLPSQLRSFDLHCSARSVLKHETGKMASMRRVQHDWKRLLREPNSELPALRPTVGLRIIARASRDRRAICEGLPPGPVSLEANCSWGRNNSGAHRRFYSCRRPKPSLVMTAANTSGGKYDESIARYQRREASVFSQRPVMIGHGGGTVAGDRPRPAFEPHLFFGLPFGARTICRIDQRSTVY